MGEKCLEFRVTKVVLVSMAVAAIRASIKPVWFLRKCCFVISRASFEIFVDP